MKYAWPLYQFLIIFLPIPFGGYENWAWPIYGILSSIILINIIIDNEKPHLPKGFLPITYVLISIQAWVFLQILFKFSQAPYDTLLALFKGTSLVLFFICSVIILNSSRKVTRILWIVSISGASQAIYGGVMVATGTEYILFLPKPDYIGKATGTFVNRNHLAGYLEIAISLSIGLLITFQSKAILSNWRDRIRAFLKYIIGKKGLLRALIIVMVIGLVLTRSRMGNTALFTSLTIVGILSLIIIKNPPKSIKPLLISVVIIDILIVSSFFGLDEVAKRVQGTSKDYEQRDEISRDTFEMWKQFPITGIGAGTFIYTFPKYKSDDHTSESYSNHAHNDYLQFLAEYGLPAFIALLGIVIFALISSIQAMRLRRNPFNIGLGFGTLMAMTSIGIHSLVDFNLQIPANSYMFCLLIVFSLIARHSRPAHKEFYESTK